jgi:ankyrin repeat protein
MMLKLTTAKSNGRSTLQAASVNGHLMIVERILQTGADTDALTAETSGRTALQAVAEGLEVILQLFSDFSGNGRC